MHQLLGQLAVVRALKVYITFTATKLFCIKRPGSHHPRRAHHQGLDNPELDTAVGSDLAETLRDELELVRGASKFEQELFLEGQLTPVFFGTALGNFGVDHMLDGLVEWAPAPLGRETEEGTIESTDGRFSGSYLKFRPTWTRNTVTAAFCRIVSGKYEKGMKMRNSRLGKDVRISDARPSCGDRSLLEEAYAGDIIGLHNHDTIRIGDTFTSGDNYRFTGVSNFTLSYLNASLKDLSKQLLKGLIQLSEEAVQVFRPLANNDLIVGAVGVFSLTWLSLA